MPLAGAGIGSIALLVFMLLRLKQITPPLFIHYSIELGVDAVGGKFSAVLISVLALVFVVINILITNIFLLQEKTVARVVAWSTLPIIGFAWFCGALIVRANGA